MEEFAAIDFETANSERSSVCSVGIVIVCGGEIVKEIYELIRPYPNYYTRWTTAVHGLTAADTYDALGFDEVWRTIAPEIDGMTLVAHNAPFDEGCLRAAFAAYHIEYPDYEFRCTLKAARHVFGKELPDHKLPTVALRCGYDLTSHHNALADAEACAQIALQIM